jgi:hypothetical protein
VIGSPGKAWRTPGAMIRLGYATASTPVGRFSSVGRRTAFSLPS